MAMTKLEELKVQVAKCKIASDEARRQTDKARKAYEAELLRVRTDEYRAAGLGEGAILRKWGGGVIGIIGFEVGYLDVSPVFAKLKKDGTIGRQKVYFGYNEISDLKSMIVTPSHGDTQ